MDLPVCWLPPAPATTPSAALTPVDPVVATSPLIGTGGVYTGLLGQRKGGGGGVLRLPRIDGTEPGRGGCVSDLTNGWLSIT